MKKRLVPLVLALVLLHLAALAQQSNLPASVAKPDFIGVESIAALVPASVELKQGGKLNRAAGALATDAIKAAAMGKIAQFKFKFKSVEANTGHGSRFRLVCDTEHVLVRGEKVKYSIYAYFAADQAEALAKLHPNSFVTVVGTLVRTELAPPDSSDRLILDLKDCQIVEGR